MSQKIHKIIVELTGVDVYATGEDAEGHVTGIRLELSLDEARQVVDELSRELHLTVEPGDGSTNSLSFQLQFLAAAMCPERSTN